MSLVKSPMAMGSSPARTVTALSAPSHQLEGFAAAGDDNTASPPDVAGAVSPDHVVTTLNNTFQVQDRKGRILQSVSIGRFWAPMGPFKSGLTDPRIVWDTNSKRFVTIILADPGENTAAMLIAYSLTANPLGDWKMTKISVGTLNSEFDFPNLAIAGKCLLISANVFKNDFYDSTANLVFFLNSLYAGQPIYKRFDDFLSTNAPAADQNPEATSVIFANNSVSLVGLNYQLVIRQVDIVANGTDIVSNTPVRIDAGDLARFSSISLLPQLGTDLLIDGGDSTIGNCVVRGQSLWCVNTQYVRYTGNLKAVVQWYQVNWPSRNAFTLAGRTRIDDFADVHYAYPSIAVNKNLEVFIGYNRFSKQHYPRAVFAYRKPTDPLESMYFDGLMKDGEDNYTKGTFVIRWGDYTTTVVDPADDTAFWTLQEYAASRTESGTSQWGTWWSKFSSRSTACSFRLDSNSVDLGVAGGTFKVTITPTPADCTWTLAPNASWIAIPNRPTTAGTATIEFAATVNKRPTTRTATITLGNQTFTVRQAANPNPPAAEPVLRISKLEAPATAKVGDSVPVTATIANVGAKGAGRFRVGFYLSTRTPVTVNDTFTGAGCVINGLVADEAQNCTASFQLDGNLAPGTYQLAAIADDRSEVLTTDRTQATRLSDAGALVVQAAATAPTLSSAGLVNAATAKPGAVAPGELLVVYGARLGPAALTTLALDATGKVATTLAGTRILFDGVAAPLIYTSSGQASVIVPYSVTGKTATQIVAEYNGVKSLALTATVALSSPGLFTVDFSGANQVAALNEDGSVNSADNPAEAGKLIVLYGTGGGTFKTQPVDGAVIGLPLPEFLAPLSLTIGGQPTEVLYAGPAPGLVSGVLQINARVPAGTAAGDKVALQVKSGDFVSPAGTTIAVK